MSLTEKQHRIARVLADTLFPGDAKLPAGGEIIPGNLESFLEKIDPEGGKKLMTVLSLFEYAALCMFYGGRFTRLSAERRERYVETWMRSRIATRRIIYRALRDTFAFLYYQDPRTWDGIGYAGPPVGLKDD